MSDAKTVSITDDSINLDALSAVQREGVSRMRTSLLACMMEDPTSAKIAIQQITVLRIYHQVVRIIKYLDLMDKLEDKLYASIEYTIDNSADANPSTWMMLMKIQDQLQHSMTESHKLLQPYLDLEEFSIDSLMPPTDGQPKNNVLLDNTSRNRLRDNAQAMLVELNALEKDMEADDGK